MGKYSLVRSLSGIKIWKERSAFISKSQFYICSIWQRSVSYFGLLGLETVSILHLFVWEGEESVSYFGLLGLESESFSLSPIYLNGGSQKPQLSSTPLPVLLSTDLVFWRSGLLSLESSRALSCHWPALYKGSVHWLRPGFTALPMSTTLHRPWGWYWCCHWDPRSFLSPVEHGPFWRMLSHFRW